MKSVSENPGSTTVDRAADVAHSAVDTAAKRAAEIEKQVRDKVHNAGEKLTETKRSTSAQVEKSIQQIEKFTKERPIAATGIAFAAGILIASILRR